MSEAGKYRRWADIYARSGDPSKVAAAKQLSEIADKMEPEFGQTPQLGVDEQGKPYQFVLDKKGNEKRLSSMPAPKFREIGTGKTTELVNEYNLPASGVSFPMQTTPGQDQTDARARDFNRIRAQEVQGGDQPMSPEAIANAAARYNIDGTLPPMGMGKVAGTYRSAILNEAAKQAQSSGLTPDEQRFRHMENKGSAAALGQLQRSEAMVGAFEKNFTKNADITLELSKQVGSTGTPLVNQWINVGKRSIAGDPKLSAYDASIKTAVNEYSKILSGSMGNQAMAEGEIKKVEAMLNAAQTPQQVEAVITLMKRETANRMAGFKEQKRELIGGMGGRRSNAGSDGWSATRVD